MDINSDMCDRGPYYIAEGFERTLALDLNEIGRHLGVLSKAVT